MPTPDPPDAWELPRLRARGLVTARIASVSAPLDPVTIVTELDARAIARVRQEALAMRARRAAPVTVDLRYVADVGADALVASLADLVTRDVHVTAQVLGTLPHPVRAGMAGPGGTSAKTGNSADPALGLPSGPDPFGLDPAYRQGWVPLLRFFFDQYWRIEVSGIEHVPTRGPALVVANHSGAIPADAFMLGAALELRQAERRVLRVLYDRFVDDLPWVGGVYRRLGGVSASFANAETLLRRNELVSLFPEGIAGVEKSWLDRYALRPFKTGTARLSLRTGAPIVPVAILGAADAYPVVTCLYRAGRLVGLPWIPVTPLFPMCGVAGALPLPVTWSMRFLPPIDPPPPDGRSEEERVRELTTQVRLAIASGIRAGRRS